MKSGIAIALFVLSFCLTGFSQKNKWNTEQAKKWSAENGWLRGCNFNPSTAINQLETDLIKSLTGK